MELRWRVKIILSHLTLFTLYNGQKCTTVLCCDMNSPQVPLVVFKREKEIARKLEFEGTWVVDQPGDDDIKGHWDKLAISTKSFPDKYWDKFVKRKVGREPCL